MVHKIVALFLAWLGVVYAIDINMTIVKGDAQQFEKLLYQINLSEKKSDEVSLQKTLLYKLINLSSAKQEEKLDFDLPKNSKRYRELFDYYMEFSQMTSLDRKRLGEMHANKETIAGVIALIAKPDESTLTRQLEYAFYHKGEMIYRDKLQRRSIVIEGFPSIFVTAMKKISFDPKGVSQELEAIHAEYQKLEMKIQKFMLDRERLNLLEKSDQAQRLTQSIIFLQNSQKELARKKVLYLFEHFTIALKNRSQETFDLEKKLLDTMPLMTADKAVIADTAQLMQQMSKSVFGTAKRIAGSFFSELTDVTADIWEVINRPLFALNETQVSFFKILTALVLFIASFYIGALYKKGVHRYTRRKRSIKLATRTLFANVGNYIIIIAAFFISLNILGIDLTSIALIAGALSVGIGFGLQNIVSNFVAGLILMFERSIKVGDYIEITDQLRGHVMDIRMRSTTITTNANIDVIVPNQDLIQKHVINWTMSDDIRRFDIPFGVAYGTDTQKVIDVVQEAVQQSGYEDLHESDSHHTRVVMVGMNNSSVDFELLVWLKGESILFPKPTLSRFLTLIYDTLYKNGIKIPFPQRDLHIRSMDDLVASQLGCSKETR